MANTPAPNSTDLRSLLNQLTGSTAPQTADAQFQFGLGEAQLGQVNPNLQTQLAYNNAMSGYQAQNLGLSEAGLGIQQTALGQQGAQSAQQQALEQQQYGLQQQGGTVIGPNGQPINIAGQPQEQSAEAALAYQNALQNTQGQQAISGTQNSVGGKSALAQLTQQYGFQQQDIARSSALAQLGQQSEVSGFQYSQEQLQNAKANLALNAQANGLSEQQLVTMLNYQNAQAGQGAAQDVIGLYSQLGNVATGQLGNVGGNLGQIGLANSGNVNTLAGVG